MMNQMALNLSARQLDKEVNYINPIQKNIINKNNSMLNSSKGIDFLMESVIKEVKSNPNKGKKYVKMILKTITISVSILTLIDPHLAFANQLADVTTNQPPTDMIQATDIMELCKWILRIMVSLGFGLALIMSVIATGLGMFKNKSQESFKWIVDIIKSFVMMMAAPAIILLIAVVSYLLFGGSEWFVKPF